MNNPTDPKTKTPSDPIPDDFGKPDSLSEQFKGDMLALRLENQSLTRRLEEAEKQRDEWRKESDANARYIADMVRDGITREKLTALRTAAEGARDALKVYLIELEPTVRTNRTKRRDTLDTALAALRAVLDQPASNASNSPTVSRESQG